MAMYPKRSDRNCNCGRPGDAGGRAVFDAARAKALAAADQPVILIRRDTSTEDVGGFAVAAGILRWNRKPISDAEQVCLNSNPQWHGITTRAKSSQLLSAARRQAVAPAPFR